MFALRASLKIALLWEVILAVRGITDVMRPLVAAFASPTKFVPMGFASVIAPPIIPRSAMAAIFIGIILVA
jgi:hypothetical protein